MSNRKMQVLITNRRNICFAVLLGCILIVVSYLAWFLRDTVLACHDSMLAFVNARVKDLPSLFRINLDYDLARGRACLLFPLVATFRDLVLKTGSYPLIWMLQYVPIIANVILLSVLLGKRFGRFAGGFTALLFFVFLQVDIFHSLIICYPLDFMYGLFCFQLSVYFFLRYVDDFSAGNKDRGPVLCAVASLALYYESLVVYESFLTSLIVFAIFSLAYAVKLHANQGSRSVVKTTMRFLWPYLGVCTLYLLIYILLRSFPVSSVRVIAFETQGTFEGFMQTWPGFATNLFPLHEFFDNHMYTLGPSIWQGYRFAWVAGVAAAVGAIVAILGMFYEFSTDDAKKRKSLRVSLGIAGLAGALFALFYTLPHGMTGQYQNWYVNSSCKGYVPSTISYFGWIVMCVALIGILVSFVASRKSIWRAVICILFAAIFGAGSMMTTVSNHFFQNLYDQENLAARNLYATVSDEEYAERGFDLIFTDTYIGIHRKPETNESLIEYEAGGDVEFSTTPEDFLIESRKALASGNPDSADAVYLHEDFEANLLFVIPFDANQPEAADPETFPANVMSNEMWVISAIGRTFHIEYQNSEGITVARDIQLAPGELTNVSVDSVRMTSVTAIAIE